MLRVRPMVTAGVGELDSGERACLAGDFNFGRTFE